MKKNVICGVLLLATTLNLTALAQSPDSASNSSIAGQNSGRPNYFMERADPRAVERARAAQKRHHNNLVTIQGVRGTAISMREGGETVVKIYVDQPSVGIAAGNGKGKSRAIPTSLDGVPVVVEAIGEVYALNVACEKRKSGSCGPEVYASAGSVNPAEWQPRPVPIGVSVGHLDVTAGTLGCVVSNGCHVYMLSNAHVLADENSGLPGDAILQPGVADGGISPDDRVGTLFDSVPIIMSTGGQNRVDAAIAALDGWTVENVTPDDGYGAPRHDTVAAALNMDVMKYGRSSKITYGYVDAINASVVVNYDAGYAGFVDQIIIKPTSGADFSRPGDSGSLVVASGGDDDRKPVGLLFSSATGISIANPIDVVLSELGVEVDGF